jgi:hypothetical protein
VEKELLSLFIRVSTIHGDILEKIGRFFHCLKGASANTIVIDYGKVFGHESASIVEV